MARSTPRLDVDDATSDRFTHERVIAITLVTEGDPDRISGGFLYQRRVAQRALEHGVRLRMVSVPPGNLARSFGVGLRVVRRAAANSDLVVVDSLASSSLAPWIALGAARGRLVGSVHQRPGGSGSPEVRRRLRRWLDLLAYRRCERIVVPSELLAEQLAAEGIERRSIGVAQPGCDVPERWTSGSAGPVGDLRSGRRAALLCVANWVERKGILDLLDAVAGLDDDLVTLHLVGDENLDERFRARVLERLTRPDLVGRVERHGVVEPGRVPDYYAGADVFVLPSTEEPYGMVYAEALVAGLPVVGWRAGNLPNLVDDGVEGRLIPVGDVGALRSVLATLACDEEVRRTLGAAARSRAQQLPSWDQTAQVFFAICRHALTAAGSTRAATVSPTTTEIADESP